MKTYKLLVAAVLGMAWVSCEDISYATLGNQIPKVTTLPATNIKACSAFLHGEAHCEDFESDYYRFFLLSEDENLSEYESMIISGGRESVGFGKYSCLVNALKPGTTYYYTMCASSVYPNNRDMFSNHDYFTDRLVKGEVLSFTTETSSISMVSTDSIVKYTLTSAVFTGSFKAETDCKASFILSETLSFESSDTIDATITGSKCVARCDGLELATPYYYKLQVSDGYIIVEGEVRSFTIDSNTITVGEAVDLGLSVKWASFNVGASAPEEHGGYYAWGEVEIKNDYSWENYKWCNGTSETITKYSGNVKLSPEDDVAHVQWGNGWRMPTKNEIIELRNKCTWIWATENGVEGYRVIGGSNGKVSSIFLPAAGYYIKTEVALSNGHGYYWSATLDDDNRKSAHLLNFESRYYRGGYDAFARYFGYTVRPVTD